MTPDAMTPRGRRFDGEIWLRFAVGTALGTAAGALLDEGFRLIAARAIPAPPWNPASPAFAVLRILLGSVGGSALGFATWLALATRVERLAPASWILRTSAASGLGAYVGSLLGDARALADGTTHDPTMAAVFGLVSGMVLGVAQRRPLARALRRELPWVAITAIAWLVGFTLAALALAWATDKGWLVSGALADRLAAKALRGLCAGLTGGLLLAAFGPSRTLPADPRLPGEAAQG